APDVLLELANREGLGGLDGLVPFRRRPSIGEPADRDDSQQDRDHDRRANQAPQGHLHRIHSCPPRRPAHPGFEEDGLLLFTNSSSWRRARKVAAWMPSCLSERRRRSANPMMAMTISARSIAPSTTWVRSMPPSSCRPFNDSGRDLSMSRYRYTDLSIGGY